MSEFPSILKIEVIQCDNIKWKSVVLLYSAIVAKEHIGKLCVVEVEDTFRDKFPAEAPEIICCFV